LDAQLLRKEIPFPVILARAYKIFLARLKSAQRNASNGQESEAKRAKIDGTSSVSSSSFSSTLDQETSMSNASSTENQSADFKLPDNSIIRQEIQNIISAMRFGMNEENFDQANDHKHRLWIEPFGSQSYWSHLRAVLGDAKAIHVDSNSSVFWLLSHTLRLFVEQNDGALPLVNDLPDMHSRTHFYNELKQIWKVKCDEDFQKFQSLFHRVLKQVGVNDINLYVEHQTKAFHLDYNSMDIVRYFVNNCRGLACVRTTSLQDERNPKLWDEDKRFDVACTEGYDNRGEMDIPKPLHWYFALRSLELFREKHSRLPGLIECKSLESDMSEMKELHRQLMKEFGIEKEPDTRTSEELCRSAGKDIHTVSAIVGGAASDLIMKLLMRQFIPMNNTFLLNTIHGENVVLNV
jgi:amyloid beta precursor protein binding protein 1